MMLRTIAISSMVLVLTVSSIMEAALSPQGAGAKEFTASIDIMVKMAGEDSADVERFFAALGRSPSIKVDGSLFLPSTTSEAGAVVVLVSSGGESGDALTESVYNDPQWRKLAETLHAPLLSVRIQGPAQLVVRDATTGSGQGLLMLLERLAEQSGHPELKDARTLLWGISAAGGFATSFAAMEPQRTIGFVRYHSNQRDVPVDVNAVTKIPALLLAGEKDETAGTEDAQQLWRAGRESAAPWAFVIEPGAPHGSEEVLRKAGPLMTSWIEAIFHQRLNADGKTLITVNDASGWLGNSETRQITPAGSFSGSKTQASWLPDETSAQGWRTLWGPK